MTFTVRALTIFILFSAQASMARVAKVRRDGTYTMTAYTTPGTTASGEQTKRRLIAADPRILPLGTQISVTNAGPYSGEYEVGDTGGKVKGRRLDIYIANDAEAKKFGRKRVRVRVLQLAEPVK